MATPLEVYRQYQQSLGAGDFARLREIVDFAGYTENCLGLTGWTTGFEIALRNYQRNILAAFSDMRATDEETVEGHDAVAIRSHIEATHVGEFLGVPATGRRIAWDLVTIAHFRDGRLVGQWVQPDLWGIYQQITERRP